MNPTNIGKVVYDDFADEGEPLEFTRDDRFAVSFEEPAPTAERLTEPEKDTTDVMFKFEKVNPFNLKVR